MTVRKVILTTSKRADRFGTEAKYEVRVALGLHHDFNLDSSVRLTGCQRSRSRKAVYDTCAHGRTY